jgi:hypothetical protein
MRRAPLFLLFLAAALGAQAGDWATFGHDNARTAVGDPLRLPLRRAWVHRAALPPEPAWPEPARNDYFHRLLNLTPGVTYDRAFHVAAARGAVFFASSASDEIFCLDATTGARRWSFVTEGPVRFAPVVDGEKVLAGSDDGWVYGLSAADGSPAWRFRLGPGDARLPGNGRMISRWPVRTGIVVEDGVAYCAAGLFPVTEGVYLAAFDVAAGRETWKRKLDLSPQGYLAAAAGKLIVPTGRTPPAAFALRDGKTVVWQTLRLIRGEAGGRDDRCLLESRVNRRLKRLHRPA